MWLFSKGSTGLSLGAEKRVPPCEKVTDFHNINAAVQTDFWEFRSDDNYSGWTKGIKNK